MQRYFGIKKEKDYFYLSSEDTYHAITVMRMVLHNKIEIIYNQKIYLSEIMEINPVIKAKIIKEQEEENELEYQVTIVQSLVKEQKMDYILQKTTELGVSEIIPYQAQRSLVKLDGKEQKKIERWQKIVKEAVEQTKRIQIPKIYPTIHLAELSKLSGYDLKLLCTVNESSKNIKKLLSNVTSSAKILFVIGPEGGFTKEEEDTLIANGFIPVSLGKSVLRTETSSTFIMSVIRYLDME